jgi:hypothetical protein
MAILTPDPIRPVVPCVGCCDSCIDETGDGAWPLPAGEYDAHDLLDDGCTSLAVAPFTVSP